MGKNGVTGIIVPLDAESVHLVFHHRPVVPLFVESFPDDLEVGDRAFLYVSGGSIIDGEGGVSSITREPVGEVRRYGDQLCLTREELDTYVAVSRKRESDEMLVLKLDEPTKYIKPMKCGVPITRGGVYMTAEIFFTILRENR
ncbi:MAG: hypothetical protein OK474_02730 [Thaumarchaeota archaeon]|nr:hypothetical protein [Nitrososphaerota archaeon]